jgi:2-phosphosulfolactate phosphatase
LGDYRICIGREGVESDGEMVIIDVLRTSSTIVTAIANGIEEVIPLKCIDDGLRLKGEYLLVGEYKGEKIPDFDIGNSPVELIKRIERGKIRKIALKSTNATDILIDVQSAYICSSLNLSAVERRLRGKKARIIVVGSENGFTEDISVALSLYSRLNDGIEMKKEFLYDCIKKCNTAKHLIELGYKEDLEFISEIDRYDLVPVLKDGVIKNG